MQNKLKRALAAGVVATVGFAGAVAVAAPAGAISSVSCSSTSGKLVLYFKSGTKRCYQNPGLISGVHYTGLERIANNTRSYAQVNTPTAVVVGPNGGQYIVNPNDSKDVYSVYLTTPVG